MNFRVLIFYFLNIFLSLSSKKVTDNTIAKRTKVVLNFVQPGKNHRQKLVLRQTV